MATKAILVVDPDAALGELIAQIISEDGYKVATVQSVAEVGPLMADSDFDVVITEAFGQMDQFNFDPTFLAELRAKIGDTPIVLCSTYPSTDTLHPGDFGLADIVPKPFTIDELQQSVKRALKKDRPTIRG